MISTPAPQLKIVRLQQDSDDDQEEFRHRMRVNWAAAIVVFGLLTIGIWLADALVEANKVQGCYASGVHSCSLI